MARSAVKQGTPRPVTLEGKIQKKVYDNLKCLKDEELDVIEGSDNRTCRGRLTHDYLLWKDGKLPIPMGARYYMMLKGLYRQKRVGHAELKPPEPKQTVAPAMMKALIQPGCSLRSNATGHLPHDAHWG